MRNLLFVTGLILFGLCACGRKNKVDSFHGINIGSAMKNISDFGISTIASDIYYVALETTENSLVGNFPDIAVWGNKIIVSSMNQPLMVFDKNDGHFCNTIGHLGDDPEAFASDGWGNIPFWIDQELGTVYLMALGNVRLLRYNLDGTFLGNVSPVFNNPEAKLLNFFYFYISDNVITAHNKYWSANVPYIFTFNALTGIIIDTITSKIEPYPLDIISSSYMYGTHVSHGGSGVFQLEYSGSKIAYIVTNSPTLWENNGQRFLKESFIDTVYSIQGRSLLPVFTIDLDKWKWPYDKRLEKDNSTGRLSIDYMLENEKFIYFHFHMGLYENKANSSIYCGIYNKYDGVFKIMNGDSFIDDINLFVPLTIRKVSSDGHFIGLIQLNDIMKWKEKQQEILSNPTIQSFIEKDDEDNPVIFIIH